MFFQKQKRLSHSKIHKFGLLSLLFFFVLFSFSTSWAENNIPEVRHSLKPLDLSRPPANEELMSAGQLGGQLYPTHEIADKTKAEEMNLSFGIAIQEWNKHNYKDAVNLFKKHIKDYPDSPWVSEAMLHIGCDAKYNGRYTEAEQQFLTIIENNKLKSHEGAKRLRTKAMQRLGILRVLQNNFDEATQIFADLNKESLSWRERTYASHWIQRISRYKASGLAMLKCGTEALAYLMEKEGKKVEAREISEIAPETEKGHSILSLLEISSRYGHDLSGSQLTTAELGDIPLPAIMQINGKNAEEKGHYWVLDKIKNDNLELYDPQSGRRFIQSPAEFSNEWTGKALVSSSKVTGEISGKLLTANEMKESYGGCCGIPRPEEDLGDDDGEEEDCSKGSPIWKVNKINLNLYIKDTPMWYTPPIGPAVKIQLSYNSQSAIANNEPFGNKWMFNYSSYLVVDTGGNVTVFMPDGRRDVYTPNGSGGYNKPFGVFNSLTKIAENHFELTFLDGTVYAYNIPAGTSSLQPFLVEIRDAYNQKLTFGYNNSIQLTTITDALNKVTNLIYNASGLVERINDPFGRSATFEYYANKNLKKATDMGGYWTQYTYDSNVYLTSIGNAKGTWSFYVEPADGIAGCNSDNYPPPGTCTWQNYRITITNPLGGKEEYYYYGGSGASTQYVSPRDYITWQSQTINNFRSSNPKTFYYLTKINNKGKIYKIQNPESDYINYSFDTSTGKRNLITDTSNNIQRYTYNNIGQVTSSTDAKNNVTNYTYYPNNIDVQTISDTLGATSYTYNDAHDVTSSTDKLGITTAYTYNSYGQKTSIIEAQGTSLQRTTENIYDSLTHNLSEVRQNSNTIMSFTYDPIGRVKTRTDSTGITLTYEYNNLDQITKTIYPDGKFEEFTYSTCCPHIIDSKTDRSGRTTYYTYDALKRLTQVQGPEGIIGYEYDANGNRTKIIDSDQKPTIFEYNLDNKLKKKIYADGKFISYAYYLTGQLQTITNSRNISKTFFYDPNYNPLSIVYSDSTPGVTFTYDNYNRMITRTDGTGLTTYTYDANNRLRFIDGPWTNDTIEMRYNELGQTTDLIPQGGQAVSYGHDTMGRLQNITSVANIFTYGYMGINPLIQSLTRPNGSKTEYLYNDPLKRLTDVINKKSDNQVINSFNYNYNDHDLRGSENIVNGTPITSFIEGLKIYNYNNVNQLLSSTNPDRLFEYDADGDMTKGYTPEGYVMTMAYDAENRMKTAEYTDSSSVVHRTEYFYSGDNLIAQMKKYQNSSLVSDTRYVRGEFLPLQERDASNNVTREYLWGIDKGGGIEGLLNLKQGGFNYSYLYDGKGNVTALFDNSQNVIATYAYDPFGKLMNKTGTLNQLYMFSTKKYDLETGLNYYGYRFYSPTIGRWISRDPIEEKGGLNLYGFSKNDPINFTDPLGESVYSCVRPLNNVPQIVYKYLGLGHNYLWIDSMNGGYGLAPVQGYEKLSIISGVPGYIEKEVSKIGKCVMVTDNPCREKRIKELVEREMTLGQIYSLQDHNCYHWVREDILWRSW